jgi:phenylpropionate dioxygenase-like ring-hydroxylating dioxygenase large terminal subunit
MSEKPEHKNKGHRERLIKRFLAKASEAHTDETLLELLLTFAIGRKDVKPIARELVEIFGSLEQVLSAPPDELYKVKGLGQISITLLKVVNFIKSGTLSSETSFPLTKGGDTNQLPLFEDTPNGPKLKSSFQVLTHTKLENQKTNSTAEKLSIKGNSNKNKESRVRSKLSKKKTESVKKIRRKFQISNGYLLDVDQLARILHFMLEKIDARKISRKLLLENTGLANRQIESLVSMGTAMGLVKPNVQVLTPIGLIIATYDIFLENRGTLEWCHYKAAGSYQNLIWFEAFNHLLSEESAMTQEGWQRYFRNKLKGKYTDKTLKDHVHQEIRFVIDAYTERNFKKLELLQRSTDARFYRRRYSNFSPLILTAMIYDFCDRNELQLSQVSEMGATPGSPAKVFGLDAASFRQQIEGLHDRGWLRYETTHNLDQIRLKPSLSAISFLTAHFEDREPCEDTEASPGGIFQ